MYVLHCKGLFTWREEDPRRRKDFSFALHAETAIEVVTEWRRCRPLAAERPAAAMFVLLVPSTTRIFRAKIVYMVLGSLS